MEKRINIAELLKDCPKGMELDCTMWDDCTFDGIEDVGYMNILVKTPSGQMKLSKEGCFVHNCDSAKCVIFPKGKTTWEGFQRPFKDGEILYLKTVSGHEYIFINKIIKESPLEEPKYYKYANFSAHSLLIIDDCPVTYEKNVTEIRFATEEEKEKLFDILKAKGYKWNPEAKALEILNEPRFKIGDRIRSIGTDVIYTIKDIRDNNYIVDKLGNIPISIKYMYELVPNKFDISTFKPFDKVLVRDDSRYNWEIDIFGRYSNDYITSGGGKWKQCIPYEHNEHLLGTKNDCDDFYKTW